MSALRLTFRELATGALLVLLAAMVVIATVWTPVDPLEIDLAHTLAAPSAAHWFGTDEYGRDVASRLMAGASTSVGIAMAVTLAATFVGVALGMAAGFLRGWTDRVISTVVNALLAFPGILLALGLLAVLGGGAVPIIMALSLAYLPTTTRVVRALVLSVRERDYIEASHLAGASSAAILARHVAPNIAGPVLVLAASLFGWAILSESALSFLGVGVPPPTPTWGSMLAEARPYLGRAQWLALAPGACIVGALLGVILLADILRDRLDPRAAS